MKPVNDVPLFRSSSRPHGHAPHYLSPPLVDYVRPDERVPREISAAPPLWLVLLLVAICAALAGWAAPHIAAWVSWSACR